MNASTAQRFRHGAIHLSELPPRVIYEFLMELAARTGETDIILEMLNDYGRLTPDVARLVGADRFPPAMRAVPRDDAA